MRVLIRTSEGPQLIVDQEFAVALAASAPDDFVIEPWLEEEGYG